MKSKKGSLIGAMLLITGSCVGAGMLALPIMTGPSGFFPALVMFAVVWSFMAVSALFMIEINSWFGGQANIVSMAGRSLGQFGRSLSWTLYLFLFYALSVAYISGSGSLASTIFGGKLPAWFCSTFFVLLFGTVVYFGTRKVDHWNRVLMIGKIAAFLGLVLLGARHVKPQLLVRSEPTYAIFSIPVLIVAFGYHNMIPSIVNYLGNDTKRVKRAIMGGSLLALVIYLIWEILVLGIVPMEGGFGIQESLRLGREAAQSMAGVLGVSWVSGFAQALAFFAILTSFLTQSLGIVHFLADGLKISTAGKREPVGLCLLAMFPPLVIALFYPKIFFKALNFAGGLCANILFGLLPAVILWIGRSRGENGNYCVFGGKPLLILMIISSVFIVTLQLLH